MAIYFHYQQMKNPKLYNCTRCKNTGEIQVEAYAGGGRTRFRDRLIRLIRRAGGIGPIWSMKPTYCICHCPYGGLHRAI